MPEVDLGRLKSDPRYAAWVRAKYGARRTLQQIPDDDEIETLARQKAKPGTSPQKPPDPLLNAHTGRRTREAINAIRRLRFDVALGLPHKALLDRIDDELFKLKQKGRP